MKKTSVKGVWGILLGAFCLALLAPLTASALMKKSYEYGTLIMEKSGVQMPVIFQHWTHRSKDTCRLCHVDIEFSMEAGATGITEEDNKDGRYCGVCHNGKDAFAVSECSKCHPRDAKDFQARKRANKRAFFKFKKNMPRSTYGNKIDWNKAEDQGLITPKDFIEGVSFPEKTMGSAAKDEPRTPLLKGLPGIVFSHQKHVGWTGCGMCHPDPFSLETGKTKMSMKEIYNGKFCGMCHKDVAFPLNDCAKCHSAPVK